MISGVIKLTHTILWRTIKVKARYENEMLKPFGKLDLEAGEEVEIEVPISMVEKTYAVSKLSDEIIEEIIETTENGE